MAWLPALIGFTLLGLSFGSFLGVVVRRLGTDAPIMRGRSRCPACGATLSWFELLPVLSFALQGGQCRSCLRRISFFYPAIELVTAALFVAIGWGVLEGILPPPPFAVGAPADGTGSMAVWFGYYAFVASVAVAVSFYDAWRGLIPPSLIRPLIALGALAHIAGAIRGSGEALVPAAAVAVIIWLFFWSLWFFSGGRAMGRGDADVALALALAFGPAVSALGLLLAFWMGAATGIVLVLAGRLGWSSRMPFAPFLFGGALAALFLTAVNPFLYVF